MTDAAAQIDEIEAIKASADRVDPIVLQIVEGTLHLMFGLPHTNVPSATPTVANKRSKW